MAFTWETVVQIIILILALRALHMVSAGNSCAEVRRNFAAKKIGPPRLVPYATKEGKDLRVCPNGVLTCCTRQMENRFQSAAQNGVMRVLELRTSSLKFNFRSFADKFQDDIIDTLAIAGNSTKEALRRSLRKKIDSDKTRVALKELEKLFRSLGLKSTGTDIRKAFNRFANRLFLLFVDDRFNVTQPDRPFEECVARERSELHPFMDVPTISAINLTTAMELARVLHEGLTAGAKAVNVTESTRLSKHCQESLLKMQYCSHCWGLTLIRPCQGLCKNVLRGCLAGVSELDQYWNYYVASLVDVTTRMRGSESKFNLEIALEDFENKLSSSLSVVFENMTSLQNAVEKRCKNARTLSRSKRTTDSQSADDDIEQDSKPNRKSKRQGGGRRRKTANRRGRGERYDLRQGFGKAFKGLEEEDPMGIPEVETEHSIKPPHEVLIHPPMKRIWRESRKAGERTVVETKRERSQLHNRIGRFISTLNSTVNFYRHLPDNICGPKGVGIEVSNEQNCWNGEGNSRYEKEVVPAGFGKQISNPEVKVLKVAKEIIGAIESLRRSTEMLLTASGQSEIPGILLHAPVYERRDADRETIPKGEVPSYPCDDEEDCKGENGSGNDKEFHPGKPSMERPIEPNIEIILGGNVQLNGSEYVVDEVDIDVTLEQEDDGKCKGKGKKCRKAGPRKKNPEHHATRGTVSTTTSGTSSPVVFNASTYLLSLLLVTFLSHVSL